MAPPTKAAGHPQPRGATLALPTAHPVPVTWLLAHACPPIKYRTLTELSTRPVDPALLAAVHSEVEAYRPCAQVARRQRDNGAWGANLLGVRPNRAAGIKDVGTIHQYRRLLELAWPRQSRAFKLADRLLYRILSRDPDPGLLFEFGRYRTAEPTDEPWVRGLVREAAAAALAQAGHDADPRVRGAAHRIASQVSQFLRSELARKPFLRRSGTWWLHPEAYPPSFFSVALLAYSPAVQRERAGLVERLVAYLNQTPTRRSFAIACGKRLLKPSFVLFGDPLQADSAGRPKDLPLALYWMELLARLGALDLSPHAARIFNRLRRDSDETGVWRPRNLRTLPSGSSPWAYHVQPMEPDAKTLERRQSDVTFRIALVAKLAGRELIEH